MGNPQNLSFLLSHSCALQYASNILGNQKLIGDLVVGNLAGNSKNMWNNEEQDSDVLFSYEPALADGGGGASGTFVVSVMPGHLFSNFHVFQSYHLDDLLNCSCMVLFLVCGLCLWCLKIFISWEFLGHTFYSVTHKEA